MNGFKIQITLKNHLFFFIFIVLLAIIRLSFIDRGMFFGLDEERYLNALSFALDLRNHEFLKAAQDFHQADARPGFILLGFIPSCFQLLFSPTNIHLTSSQNVINTLNFPEFYTPVSIFNVLISLLNSLLFYLISLKLIQQKPYALLSTLTWSLLCNTNLYLRHLSPCDWALHFFLLGLYINLAQPTSLKSNKYIILSGAISAFAVTIYPGLYMFYFINFFSAYLLHQKQNKVLGFYILPLIIWLCILETTAQLSGGSYILSSLTLSDTVLFGSFSESLVFLPKYFFHVEGLIGIFLIVLFLLFLINRNSFRHINNTVIWIALACYITHGLSGIIVHKFVFYGRIIHMYVPFVVWGAFIAISSFKNNKIRCFFLTLSIIFSLISFNKFYNQFSALMYPKDLKRELLKHYRDKHILFIDENQKPNQNLNINYYDIVAVNIDNFISISKEYYAETFSNTMKLSAAWPHPITFSAYTYEGLTIEERNLVQTRNYKMKIYFKK